jgi:undecaprenyl-phosphate 4-deoxy-4-formamido-L-arabinose transferase
MVTSFSVLPLRWLSLLGAFVCGVTLLCGATFAAAAAFVPGLRFGVVPVLVILLFLLIGVLFLTLGFVGEYVGRIYNEVRQRPRYAIRAVHEGGTAPALRPAAANEDERRRRPIDLRDED